MIRVVDFIGLVLYCSLIFWLSSQPVLPVPMLFSHQDKLHHATAYFIMAILAWRNIQHFTRHSSLIIIISIIFCSLYGLTDEWHQSFIQGRQADVNDWIADTLGASLAMLILYKLFMGKKSRLNNIYQ